MTGESKSISVTQQAINSVHMLVEDMFKQRTIQFVKAAEKIDKVESLLSDQSSRKVYRQEMAYLVGNAFIPNLGEVFNPMPAKKLEERMAIADKALAERELPKITCSVPSEGHCLRYEIYNSFFNQGYCYGNLIKIEKDDVFLDCGAYVGDTTLWAYQQGAARVYSFEPSNEMFQDLKNNLTINGFSTDYAVNSAISNTNSTEKFWVCSGLHVASALHDNAQSQNQQLENNQAYLQDVACIRLDDWCEANQVAPTFIKMDVEGAELDALKGCAKTIQCLKPKLAISIYHSLDQYWDIPLYIHDLVPEYKLFCRKNYRSGDVVIYAIV